VIVLNDLDARLNQPVDTATDIAVTSVTESSKDAAEKKYENDFLQAIQTTADEGARNVLEVGIPARGGVLVPMSWDKELIRILEEKSLDDFIGNFDGSTDFVRTNLNG
jgi:hypothetical protein